MKLRWLPPSKKLSLRQMLQQKRDLSFHDPSDLLNNELDSPNPEQFPDESLFANIEEIIERITHAMYQNQPLLIFGHDDPDGICSTYILYRFLSTCGYQAHNYYIPNRETERHGIQNSLIEYVHRNGYKLVIVVDNGISSKEGVEKLHALGCEVIIIDHHIIQKDTLPNAFAIMNPQLSNCNYPFKQLAGVGVVLMLIRYLSRVLQHEVDDCYYFWTAVGSYADKVPLIGVNWAIARYAIDRFSVLKDSSIDFLCRNHPRISSVSDIWGFIQSTARLIANGREDGGNHLAMRFLLQMGEEKAAHFEQLEKQKNDWECELNRVFKLMDSLIEDFAGDSYIHFDDNNSLPYPLLGTAASYTVNQLGIPAIFLKRMDGVIVCEGRCSDGFNMTEAFSNCKEHLIQFGGHVKAAGFTMKPESYNDFLTCYKQYVSQNFKPESDLQYIQYDAELLLSDINRESWEIFETFIPFGQDNSDPVFLCSNEISDEVSEKLLTEYIGKSLPKNRKIDFLFNWKAPNIIRVIDWHESEL